MYVCVCVCVCVCVFTAEDVLKGNIILQLGSELEMMSLSCTLVVILYSLSD